MKRHIPVYFAALLVSAFQISAADAKYYGGKECRSDYRRLCGNTPRGKCDLATKLDQLSPACKALVQKGG